MKALMAVLTPLIVGIAQSVFKTLAQNLWDSLWALVVESVEAAEKKFRDSNYSKAKKQFVIDKSIEFLKKYRKLSKIQLWAITLFLGKVIDRMIDDMNLNNGKGWVQIITDLKAYWANRIPYIS